ncbi:MAG: DUF6155 family protein [Pyrinomonadaceae bacterium]
MKDTSLRELKQYLRTRTPEQLVEEIGELFRKSDFVRDYYLVKLRGGEDDEPVRDKYKANIKDVFFPRRGGFTDGFPRLAVARKAVSEYRKVAASPSGVADLMLYYVETGVRFTNEYGDIDEPFYNSMESMYERALKLIVEHGMQEPFGRRCQQVVYDTSGIGWGFHDQLGDLFDQYLGR